MSIIDKKLEKTILTVVAVVALVLVGAVIYHYTSRPVPKPGVTVKQALQGQQNALHKLSIEEQVNKANTDKLNTQVTNLTNQKTALCSTLKIYTRATNPNCL